MIKLYKKWHGIAIEDDLTVNSKEFKSFYRQFINAVKRTFPDCKIKGLIGHYYLSGFITNSAGKVIYFCYHAPRGTQAIDFNDNSPLRDGILYRAARNDKDYGGVHSRNHFTDLLHFQEDVLKLFGNDAEFKRIA